MNETIRGRCDGLEADPVWETPLPDGHHADTVAAILEAVRKDWRNHQGPVSGYRIDLAYTPDTGHLDVTMGPADPNEEPPADLITPLPFRRATMSDYWPEGPFDHEAAAAALPADAAERIMAAMGIDRNDPVTAAILEEVENDGLDFAAARAEADRRAQAVIDSLPAAVPLDALPAGAEIAAILRANGVDPDRYRIEYGPRAHIDLSGGDPDPATNPYTGLFRTEPTEREEHQP